MEYYKVVIPSSALYAVKTVFLDAVLAEHMPAVVDYALSGIVSKVCRNFKLLEIEEAIYTTIIQKKQTAVGKYGKTYWNNTPSKFIEVETDVDVGDMDINSGGLTYDL